MKLPARQKLVAFLGLMLCSIGVYCQQIPITTQRFLGGSGNDMGQFTVATNDGNLLVIGVVQSGDGNVIGYRGGNDIWVTKVSPAGVIQWQKPLGGTDNDVAVSYAYNKADGSLTIAANTFSNNGDVTVSRGMGDAWVVKLNTSGAILWQRTYGGSNKDASLNIINTSDGNCLLSVETYSNNNDMAGSGSHGGSEIWLAKINSGNGNIIWKRCYGGSGNELGTNGDAYGSSLTESPANNYIFTANTGSADGDVTGFAGGSWDAWVVKTDVGGNIVWQKCVGGDGADLSRKLRIAPNGNLVLLAQSGSGNLPGYHRNGTNADTYDALVAILQPNGTIIKQKCFGSPYSETPFELQVRNDSNFVFAAKVWKDGGDVSGTNTQDNIARDIWIVSLKDTSIVWAKTFGGTKDEEESQWAGNNVSVGDISLLPGKGILFTGITKSNDGNVVRSHPYGGLPDYDIWILVLDSAGNIQMQNTLGYGGNEWAGGTGALDTATNTYYFTGSTESYNNNSISVGLLSDLFFYRFSSVNYVKGRVYFDNNSDSVQNADEPLVNNAWVTVAKTGALQQAVTVNGNYLMQVDTGKYQITCLAPKPYFTVVPALVRDTIDNYFRTDTFHFGLRPIPNKRDLAVAVLPVKELRLDSLVQYRLVYFNQGTDTISVGTVAFKKDSRMSFVQATPDTSSASGDTLYWNYTNFKPFEMRTVNITLKAGNVPVLNTTDSVLHFAKILPDATDITPADNRDTVYHGVSTAAVSNGKFSTAGNYIYQQFVTDTGYINYTIRFQNTTIDVINNLTVTDSLDAAVDTTSFQMLDASHNYTLSVKDGKVLVWTFNNIFLPRSAVNDAGSRGYISFRVRLKTTTPVGTQVSNKAYIKFDKNAPVITNTVTSEIKN